MDWTQLISLAGYTTAVCYFFYRLNEKSIEKLEKSIEKMDERSEKQIRENENHWRELFIHMSGRIDKMTEN